MAEKTKDFYSKDVADAIRQACAEFSTTQEKLEIEVLETGSAGIFGLCKKRAHIRATLKDSARDGEASEAAAEEEVQAADKVKKERVQEDGAGKGASADEAVAEKKKAPRQQKEKKAEPRPVVEQPQAEPPADEVMQSIRSDVGAILDLMHFPAEVNVAFEDGSIQCRISGQHEEEIIGPEGKTLDSLQYLVRKMMSRDLPDRMMIDLDAGNFRERRTAELQKMAAELAEKVKENGKTQAIPSLNPSERRVVHVALQDDKKVRSRSVGDGLFKKVLIYKPGGRSRKSGSRRRGRQGGGSAAQ